MHKNLYKIIKNKGLVQGGLTLIELMVVIGIFLIITTTVIANYGGFKSSVSLQNLTDDIALSIRKAQSFAIGARGVHDTGDTRFNDSYGMHFSANSATEDLKASKKSFLMFSTKSSASGYVPPNAGVCDGASNNCIEYFKITSTDVIKEIKLNPNTTTVQTINPDSYLDIIFTRPNPRAIFCHRTVSSSTNCNEESISSVSIIVWNGQDAPNSKTKTISVQNTGQISVSNE